MISTEFIFDNIHSEDMGLHIVRLENGFFNVPIGGAYTPVLEKIPYKNIPYHYRTDKEMMNVSLTFTLLDEEWTPDKLYNISKWLFTDTFKEFQTLDDLSKVYYIMFTSDKNFSTLDYKNGYFTLEATLYPFSFSPKLLINTEEAYGNLFNELNNAKNGTTNTITLYSGSSSVNNIYNNETIYIIEGTGVGQSKTITAYNGTTKVATVNSNWATTPDATSRYYITKGIQSATNNTVVLDQTANSVDDYYNGKYIYIESGTGYSQLRRIIDYVGSTKTATVDSNFSINPDNTSKYILSKELILENKSNVPINGQILYTPKYIEFTMKGSTYFNIINQNDGGRQFEFTGINNNETIKVDDLEQVFTSVVGEYRIGNFNKNFLRLVYGQNKFHVIGRCDIEVLMQYPLYR